MIFKPRAVESDLTVQQRVGRPMVTQAEEVDFQDWIVRSLQASITAL